MKKIKILALILMAVFCVTPYSKTTAKAASTKVISVHAKYWTIHGLYEKSETSRVMYAKNYSGYGEFGYCYGHCRSNISGQWAQYTPDYRLYKNNSEVTMNLSNTIDEGKSVSLRLKGADTQVNDDDNCVKFTY